MSNINKTTSEHSEKINVKFIERDVQTNEVIVTLNSVYRNKPITQKISRENINSKGLKELSKFGFPFLTKESISDFIEYFIENEHNFPVIDVYKALGWHTIENKEVFLHKYAIINGETKKLKHIGLTDISLKGTLNEFTDFFNRTLKDSIGLQTVCAVSLASAIVGRIKNKDLRFIFHIEGTSTSGKTTSLMLAGSLWGNPQIAPNSVVKNWNITGNKLVQSAGGNNGILIGLDELAMSNADNTQLTYLLTGGNDKQRMTNDNTANSSFNTVFMSTGEIQFKSSNFGGIAVRLFEVKNHNFTKNKIHAEDISNFITTHYGTVGFEFAKALTRISQHKMTEKLDEFSKKVQKRIKNHAKEQGKTISPLFSRMADKIAAVALAANIAKNKLGIDFDISSIVDFLICRTTLLEIGQEQSVEAADKFLEEYAKNKSNFPDTNTKSSNIWGKSIIKNGELSEIVVLYNQFVKIMGQIGFPDTASLIKAMKEKSFIKCEQDKNYSRRTVGNIKRAKVIVLDISTIKGGAENED